MSVGTPTITPNRPHLDQIWNIRSVLSHAYLVFANLPPLRRDWLSNSSTIFTVCASYLNLCSRLDMLVAGVGFPSASAKILSDLCSVCMMGSPTIPVWEVHAVSHDVECIVPYSTSCLTCCSVSLVCGGCSYLSLYASEVRMCGCCCHFVMSLYWWCWRRVKRTLRLPLLASGGLVVVTWKLQRCSAGASSSTWLVSRV